MLHATLAALSFPENAVATVANAAANLPDRQAFLAFREAWWQAKPDTAAAPPLWNLLAVVSAFPSAFALHRERGIPWEVTTETLADLPRRMKLYEQTHGQPGFDAQRWMLGHVRGRLFQLGRLQYGVGRFFPPADVYAAGSTPMAFAHAGLVCDSQGWPSPTPGFTTRRTLRDASLHAHRVLADGALSPTPEAIPPGARRLLHAGSDVLHIHIPTGGKLDPEACLDSLARAREFFARHFPETPFAGFCCHSWLLDRAFGDFISPRSNIATFGQLFSPLPCPDPTAKTHLRWIFGPNATRETAARQPARNPLQQALLDYLAAGHHPRVGGGYILW